MSPLTNQRIVEGEDLSVICNVTFGNPTTTTFSWIKRKDPGFKQNTSRLNMPDIQRSSSGNYICTAENNYTLGGKGSDSRDMTVDVLCKFLM